MRKQRETQVANLLNEYLRLSGLKGPYAEFLLLQTWQQIVSPEIAAASRPIRLINQILWIRIDSPSLRAQLSMITPQLVQQLNAAVGCTIIYDLKFI